MSLLPLYSVRAWVRWQSTKSYATVTCLFSAMLHVWTLKSQQTKALLLIVNSHEGRKQSTSWTRPPGRPHRAWLNLVKDDANAIRLSSLWRTDIFRGYTHGAAQWSVRRTTQRWWWYPGTTRFYDTVNMRCNYCHWTHCAASSWQQDGIKGVQDQGEGYASLEGSGR